MALESLILNGLQLNDGTNFVIRSIVWNPPQKQPLYITNPAADGQVLVQESHYTEASFEIQLQVKQQATMTAALAKAGELVDRLQTCERFEGGVPVEWKPQNGTNSYTAYAISGDLLEVPLETDGDLAGWLLRAPQVKIKLTCRPFLYGTERTAKSAVESGAEPQQVIYVPDVGGDVPAEARLLLKDTGSFTRRFIEVGQDLCVSETNPTTLLTAAALTVTGFAGTSTTHAGAYSEEKVKRMTALGTWATMCGTGVITNTGTYRVKARVWAKSSVVRWRLAYRTGDGPALKLEPVAAPAAEQFCEIDLGEVSLDTAALGSQKSELRLEVMTTDGSVIAENDLNYLRLVPTGVGWARARGLISNLPTAVVAYDSFKQEPEGNLAGKTLESGGGMTWALVGGTKGDFKVHVAGSPAGNLNQATRTAKEDADLTEGAFEFAGTNEQTDAKVSCEIDCHQAGGPINFLHGVFLRGDSANKRAIVAGFGRDEATNKRIFRVAAVFGGGVGVLPLAATTGELPIHKAIISLEITAEGVFRAWCYPPGETEPAPLLQGFYSPLASGGLMQKGRAGLYDAWAGTSTVFREYDNFQVVSIEPTLAVCYSGKTAEWRSDGFLRQDSSGTYYGVPSLYRGGNLYLPHEGADQAVTRLVIAMRRNDIDAELDPNVTDKHSAEVKVRERYLLPR